MEHLTLLETKRKEKRMSREDLAILAGVSTSTIQKIERLGYTDYKAKTARKLAEALGIHKRYIFKLGDK